jgi:hypothetical protein
LLPPFVGIVVIGMTAEYLLFSLVNPVIAAFVVLITVGLSFRVYGRLPDDVLNWEREAKGERATAEHLGSLAAAGFISFANRWGAGSKATSTRSSPARRGSTSSRARRRARRSTSSASGSSPATTSRIGSTR